MTNQALAGLVISGTILLGFYALASGLNLGVPDSGARYPRSAMHLRALLRRFAQGNATLWRDAEGGLSLAATTIFWGAGATLQFALLRWAIDVLDLTLDRAAYLQAAVAVGVVAGAAAAGRWVPLRQAPRMLAAGVAMGLLIPFVASVREIALVVPLLALVGVVGGFMVVPLNALLQHRGFVLLTAGRSIAVQGFNENLSVLAMLAVYATLLTLEVPIAATLWLLGLFVAAVVGVLMLRGYRRGKGFGVALLQDAVLRIRQAAAIMGIRGIMVHAISNEAKIFYERHGFVADAKHPMTLLMSIADQI